MARGDEGEGGPPLDAAAFGAEETIDAASVVETPTPAPGPAILAVRGAALAPGLLLAGRYRIGARVGQGGMGTVYAAHDTDLDEDVALKVLRADVASDKAYRARLRAEVRLPRRVSPPTVCRGHHLGIVHDL